jgi:aspartate aminotransferase
MNVSDRLLNVPSSPIRKLVPLAQDAKAEGVDVLHLNIGDPDIRTPEEMLSVLNTWDRATIGYDQSKGNPALIASLVQYYSGLGYPFVTNDHIQVTTGGSEAISMAMFAVCEPGDEVLVFEPFYANYNSYAIINGVTLVPVPTSISNGFHFPDVSIIEKLISSKTKAILFCNPNNPTGTVYTKQELDMLVRLAKKHSLFLLSDEVYREYTYDGRVHISLLSYMNDHPDRTIVLDSLSKRYSLCGARVGALISLNQEIMSGVLRIAQGRLSSGLIDQLVASQLIRVKSSYMSDVHDEYRRRRDVIYQGLKKIPGVTVPLPEGAFYVIAALPVDDAETFCEWLLTDFRYKGSTVMLAPAAGFYSTSGMGQQEVRIAYVLGTDRLSQALTILTKALSQYPNRRI